MWSRFTYHVNEVLTDGTSSGIGGGYDSIFNMVYQPCSELKIIIPNQFICTLDLDPVLHLVR